MNKKGEGLALTAIAENGQVIVWTIVAILAIWLLIKFLFK